jgi:hypothetical protein
MNLIKLLLDLSKPRQLRLKLMLEIVELILDHGKHVGPSGQRPRRAGRALNAGLPAQSCRAARTRSAALAGSADCPS